MSALALLALLALPAWCTEIHGVSVCSAGDATAPSAASPGTPNGVETAAPAVPRIGAADGSHQDQNGRSPLAIVGRWVYRGGEVAALGGWAVTQLLRSGDWGGETALVYENDSRENDVGEGEFELARKTLRGEVTLRNSSLVFGPRLVTGNVGLNFSLGRDVFTVSGQRAPGVGKLAGYDLGMTVLPDRDYSVGVFAARTRVIFPRLFGTAREQHQTRHGAIVRLRKPFLDSTIDWASLSFESSARTDRDFRQDAEERNTFAYNGNRRTSRQTLVIEARRERRRNLIFPDLTFPFQVFRLRHGLLFGAANGGRSIVTSIGFNRRGGSVRRDHHRAETRLDFQLTPTLDTRSTYRAERVDTTGIRQDRQSLDSRVRHRLYESLVTTLAARGALENLDTGRRTIWGGSALFDYRKKLIAGGRLTATVSRRYDREDNRFAQQEDVVVDERHEARLGEPFRLEQPRVNPASIVVSDAAQTRLFREGFDYAVDVIGEFVEIRVLPGGRIDDGQLLVVDYRIRTSPLTSIATTQPLMDLSVDYGWINPYVRLQSVNRTLLRGDDDGTVFDRRTRAVGVRFRWSYGNLRVALRNERRTEDARNLAFDAFQFSQVILYLFQPGRVLTFDLDEGVTDFHVPVRRELRRSGRLAFRWRLTPVLSVEANGAARYRRDTAGFDETFNQAGIGAQWDRQTLDLVCTVSRDWGDRAGAGFRGLRVSVHLSRAF